MLYSTPSGVWRRSMEEYGEGTHSTYSPALCSVRYLRRLCLDCTQDMHVCRCTLGTLYRLPSTLLYPLSLLCLLCSALLLSSPLLSSPLPPCLHVSTTYLSPPRLDQTPPATAPQPKPGQALGQLAEPGLATKVIFSSDPRCGFLPARVLHSTLLYSALLYSLASPRPTDPGTRSIGGGYGEDHWMWTGGGVE
ncbi:hypothetical protein DFP73DRAFT_555217 [Morchella snyderi]|nr:hypothetical protein DFP73DRAFT_555217 [Morchella snyderi]